MNRNTVSQKKSKSSSLHEGPDLHQGTGNLLSSQTVIDSRNELRQSTRIKLSMNQMTTMRWPLFDEISQIHDMGLDAIGLWRPKVAGVGVDVTAEHLRDAGVAVSSLSFVGGFTGRHGFSYDDAIADGRDAIADAADLGAENVIVVGGPRNFHTVRHCRRIVVSALEELAERAWLMGVRLLLLPMHSFFSPSWTFLNTLDDAIELLDQVGHPSVGLAFDTYHLWREPRLFDRITEIASITGVVQVSDANRFTQTDSDRMFPGLGMIPNSEIVKAFLRSGFDGYFDIQVWSDEEWSKSRDEVTKLCFNSVSFLRGRRDVTSATSKNV